MKKIITIFFATVFLVSCKQKDYGAFTVGGFIQHAPSQKISLQELSYTNTQPVVLDSTSLQKDGSFKLHAIAKEESLYLLAIENGPSILVVNDSKDIQIKLDVDNYKNYSVQNSTASQELHSFLDDYKVMYDALIQSFEALDSLQKTKATDSAITVINLQKETQLKKINTFLVSFIKNSNSPAVRYFAIGKAIRTMQPDEVQELTTASAKAFSNHAGLAQLKKSIDEQIAADPKFALLNKLAPELNMADTAGKHFSLSSLKGKYVLVDFWASWCKPCREENPNVVAAYKKFSNKNFTVLGVSLDNDKTAWINAINQDSLTWQHISDLKQWESDAVKLYKFNGIPFNVLLNPEGKVIAVELRGKELDKKLEDVFR